MKRFSWSISRYIVGAILPYFVFAWLLLSVILFVQQASRYSDIFFDSKLPASLIWQLSFALIPSVVAFTCPMAILIGVIIGLTKLQGDSELVAIRASGVGNFTIALPIVLLGIALSAFAFFVNLKGVPLAAQVVRKVALQTAILKLQSPIEPGVFNTELAGYTIYVKDGDLEKGTWKRIFIYSEDKKSKSVRLITAESGWIDTSGNDSELVLDNAIVSTLPAEGSEQKYISERVGGLRYDIPSKRGELIERLSKTEESPDEMGLNELAAYSRTKSGKEKTEADILWHRRILLSITPLLFALLGTSLVLRFNRGGKGWGVFLALVSLVSYYLVALMGEQLARTNAIGVQAAGLLPIVLTTLAIIWFFYSQRLRAGVSRAIPMGGELDKLFRGRQGRRPTFSFRTGILDADIALNLVRYFLLTFGFFAAVFIIFTSFENWKFAGAIDNGFSLLTKYIFYLIPFIYIQLAPSALMIATLATYVIKSRQNEIVTWTAAGQSTYRLLLPCFLFMILLGGINWVFQEYVMPDANKIQDSLRIQIRNKGIFTPQKQGKNWVASDNRIYSFELSSDADLGRSGRQMANFSAFQFDNTGSFIESVTTTERAIWERGKISLAADIKRTTWSNSGAEVSWLQPGAVDLEENYNPFNQTAAKPAHLTSKEIRELLINSDSDGEKRAYRVALEKRRSTLFLPFIITLFTAPFALSLSRKGKAVTVGYAVAIWLLFIGTTSAFEQFGVSGFIAPKVAVWGPLALFAMLGLYLLSKIKT